MNGFLFETIRGYGIVSQKIYIVHATSNVWTTKEKESQFFPLGQTPLHKEPRDKSQDI